MNFNTLQLTPADIAQALRQGLDPNATTPSGLSMLRRSSEHPEVVKALLDAGADPNQKSLLTRYTALHETENPETVKVLVEYGADLEARSASGCTALHMACGADRNAPVNHKKIEALLEAGARVDAQDNRGNTPLHLARSARAVDMLLDAGADLYAVNNDGYYPGQTLDHGLDEHAEDAIERIHWHEDARKAEHERQQFEARTAQVVEDWHPSQADSQATVAAIESTLSCEGEAVARPRSRCMRL